MTEEDLDPRDPDFCVVCDKNLDEAPDQEWVILGAYTVGVDDIYSRVIYKPKDEDHSDAELGEVGMLCCWPNCARDYLDGAFAQLRADVRRMRREDR